MEKNEVIKMMMEVEYCVPSELAKMDINIKEAKKIPMESLATLGVAFQPLTQLVSYVAGGSGQSGLYFVNTVGKKMFKSKGEFIGNLKANNGSVGGGIARLKQIPFDPTMLCMGITLLTIEKKLATIEETQKQIIAFLEIKERAKLKGNLNSLTGILNNYKFNWDNEKYKINKHILVQDIKRESEQSIFLYQEQITNLLSKNKFLNRGQKIKEMLNETINILSDYQLSLYIFSFSSFLEIMLLENFDTNYLNSISNKIQEYSIESSLLYEKCFQKFEKDSVESIESHAFNSLSKISSGTGKVIEKIPIISKYQIDESLIKMGSILQDTKTNRIQNVTKILLDSQNDYIGDFVNSIETLEILYNKPMNLMFDEDNIYIASS